MNSKRSLIQPDAASYRFRIQISQRQRRYSSTLSLFRLICMSGASWSRAETGRLQRSSSTSLLPTIAWHQIPGIPEKNSPFPVRNIDRTLAGETSSTLDLPGEELQAQTEQPNSEKHTHTDSEFDYDKPVRPGNSSPPTYGLSNRHLRRLEPRL